MAYNFWNPWHGCHKVSAGCTNCYMYRRDSEFGKDSSIVCKTQTFDLPLQRNSNGWVLTSNKILPTCMTSDFFIAEADEWRHIIWDMMKIRYDLNFLIPTKRIERFYVGLPDDWGDGYSNITIACTCENQEMADERLPVFLSLPIKHRWILAEPLLEDINLSPYLDKRMIDTVMCGGESGDNARVCDKQWVLNLRHQCFEKEIPFCFKQTGSHFLSDGKLYTVPREKQISQAKKSKLSTKWLI